MTIEELKIELAAILALEDQTPTDWPQVEARSLAVIGKLNTELEPSYPHEVVYHFLDDPGVRMKSPEYATMQQERLRQWLEAG